MASLDANTTICVDLDGATIWKETEERNQIWLRPGPAGTVATCALDLSQAKLRFELQVSDALGRPLWTKQLHSNARRMKAPRVIGNLIYCQDDADQLTAYSIDGDEAFRLQLQAHTYLANQALPDNGILVADPGTVSAFDEAGKLSWSTQHTLAPVTRPVILDSWIAVMDPQGAGISLDMQGNMTGRFAAVTSNSRCCVARQGDTLLCQAVNAGRLYAYRNGGRQKRVGSDYYYIKYSAYDPETGRVYLVDYCSPGSARLTPVQQLMSKLGMRMRIPDKHSRLMCLDRQQRPIWSAQFDNHYVSEPVIASDGLVYVGWGKTYLKAFKP